ncbi:hypothetical protein [Nitrospirillum iridis]|uniref:Transposase n=1 Tax=Nitrospirillum iridis TaxID=765888 RepID=A0A7X0EEF4_9PROT|nr:hypothetical protein [Nitrospirillum iridis]MBB6253813.1 hypothetical protein [Nitrospirillum iridis]
MRDGVHDVGRLFPDEKDPDRPATPGLSTPGRVVSTLERNGKSSVSILHYLSSAHRSAAFAAKAVPGYCAIIENGLRWVIDTIFQEDAGRARKDHGSANSPSSESPPQRPQGREAGNLHLEKA